jgi:predicted enzyme related to lactoylglutathione lyase/quinol monooxygenase YgiN
VSLTTVLVHYDCKEGAQGAVADILSGLLERSLSQEDCYRADVLLDGDVRVTVWMEWSSEGAHVEFERGVEQNNWWPELMDRLTAPPDTRYLRTRTKGGGPWGGPQHLELSSAEPGATTAFLAEVFGWRFTEYMPGYHGFWAPGSLFGGVRLVVPGEAPRALPYLVVDDIDARVDAVQAAGAAITVPLAEVPGAGRRFAFRAPGGLELAVWGSRSGE